MARERYLVGEGEDTIHSNQIGVETGKQKRQNWWYYNKLKLLVGAVAVLMIGSFVYSIASKVEPDYIIALMTSYSMPEEGLLQLENCISEYAEDRNGDGKVVVKASNYPLSESIATSDPMQYQASSVRFMADVSSNEAMIFLHDEAAFDFMKGNLLGMFAYNDGKPMPDTAEDYENAMIPWSEIAAFQKIQLQPVDSEFVTSDALKELFSRLRMTVRTAQGSSIEKQEKAMAYYQDSLALYQRLLQGEKITARE